MQSPERKFILGGLIVALLCTFSYVFIDRQVILHYQDIDYDVWRFFRFFTQAGDALYPLLLGGVALLVGGVLRSAARSDKVRYWSERARVWGMFLFVSVAASGLLTNLLKIIFGRARPRKFITDDIYGFYFFEFSKKFASFPSGHSNTVVVMSLVLWYLWPKSWPLGVSFSGFIILSRIVCYHHFPSDTLAGAYLAVLTTYYIHLYFKRRYPSLL